MIICIDETGFRSDTVKDMKWQFKTYMKKQKIGLCNAIHQEEAPLNVLSKKEYDDAIEYLDNVNK